MFRSRRRASAELPHSAPPPSAARRKRARTRMSSRARRPVGLHTATHSLFVTLLHTCRTRRTTIFPTYVVNVILKCYMYFNNFSRCVRSPGNTWSWISWLKKNSVKETTESASTGARRVPTNDAVSEAPRREGGTQGASFRGFSHAAWLPQLRPPSDWPLSRTVRPSTR